jgi:ribosomal protein S18 acetylase RimI-like enzyme
MREATGTDAAAIAGLHVQTFNETHGVLPGGGPALATRLYQWTAQFAQQDSNWFCFVIEDNAAQLVGFATGLPYKDESLPYDGQLNKIYVLRSHQKRSLGRLLLCAIANRLLSMGIHSMLLFGEASNPSNGFYERMGAEKLYAANGEFHGGYAWKDLHTLSTICPK